jgi:hypothetical protein
MGTTIESIVRDYGLWLLSAAIVVTGLAVACHLRFRRLRAQAKLAEQVEDTLVENAQGLILSMHGIMNELDPNDRTRERTEKTLDRADQQLSEVRGKIEDLRASD